MLETTFYESDFESDLEAAEDLFEDFEAEAEAEWDERTARRGARRRTGAPVRTPPRGNAVARQVPQGHATKAELAATAKRLDDRIGVLSTSVKTLATRSASLEAETGRIGTALRRELMTRKKTTDDLKRTLDETRQISMLLPLLATPGTVTIEGRTFPVNEGDSFSKILPILMFSGSGSGGAFGGSGGDNSGMMMAVLAIALSGR